MVKPENSLLFRCHAEGKSGSLSEWDGEKKRAVDAGKGLGGKSQACMVEMRQGTFLGNRGPGAVWRRGMPCLRQSHASQGDK